MLRKTEGDYKENSDIDVMILTPLSKEEIEKVENQIFDLAFDLELESGIVISQSWKMKPITDTGWGHCHFMIMWRKKELSGLLEANHS